MKWLKLFTHPGDTLPAVLREHRGQIRIESGDGVSTADTLHFGRDNAGTMEWVDLTAGGGGGGGSVTAVALSPSPSLGSIPAYDGSFTITDASLSSSKRVLVWQVPNGDDDELEMDTITATAAVPTAGSVSVYWQAQPGPVSGTQAFNYLVMDT